MRREVNILLWRRSRNPGFPVIPALLGIDAAAVELAGFEELAPVQAASSAGRSPAEVAALTDAIIGRFPRVLPDSSDDPVHRWVRRMSRTLHTIAPSDREVLQEAGRRLDLPFDLSVEWAHEDACRLLAAQLIGHGLPGLRLVRALSEVSHGMDAGPFTKLSLDALPSWVDAEAARLVLPQRRGEDPRRMTVLLDVAHEELAEDYVARAMCREVLAYECVTVRALPTGESPADEVLADCRDAVRGMLALPADEPLTPDAPRIPDKVHYLLLHPGEAPPAAVAAAAVRLHGECPWLVVVVLGAGDRITSAMLTEAGAGLVVRIEPALGPAAQQQAVQLRREVGRLATETYGDGRTR